MRQFNWTGRQGDRETGRKFGTYYLLVSLSPLLFVYLLILATACGAPPLKGTDLGKEHAPDFQLSDARGNQVSLADFRGKVVVLTFMYTNCPDECPLTAAKLRLVADQLGDAMKQVAYITVSVDPQNDTPIAIQQFLQQHLLDGQMRYLIGTQEQLAPVWTSYYVATSSNSSSVTSITHSLPIYVIDKTGNRRVELDSGLVPADLVYDVRALLNE